MEAKDKMSLVDVGLILVLIGGLTIFIAKFIKLGREKKIEMINEWLLLAVVQAEKELGNGTGQIKLRFVYDMFIAKFKYASMMISFNQFSLMVDSALDKMRQMLSDNNNLKAYVDGQ